MGELNIKGVIDNGYCIGCGICAHLMPDSIKMVINEFGQFQAVLVDPEADTAKIDSSCPFSDMSVDEDQIGKECFGEENYFPSIGFFQSTYAGYVSEENYRMSGSSGGFGSWLCTELLRLEVVKGIIHVKSSESENLLFEYGFSETANDIRSHAKSKYYPVQLDEVLDFLKSKSGPFLFVGIPCMVKAIRLLARENPAVKTSIALTLGLVCGHIKSKGFSEMLGWQMGVPPDQLAGIDFRTKLEGFGSNQYGVTVFDRREPRKAKVSPPVNQMFGTNWGLGYFKSKACDFCDDVMAETADVTIGDAWLPEYVSEMAGTNIVVVRNEMLNKILIDAQRESRICLDLITPDRVVLSQKSGISHRRNGLQYRLHLNEKASIPSPRKRVEPSSQFSRKFKKIQRLRVELRDQSHIQFLEAKRQGNYLSFVKGMEDLNLRYSNLYKTSILARVIRKLKRSFF